MSKVSKKILFSFFEIKYFVNVYIRVANLISQTRFEINFTYLKIHRSVLQYELV